MKSENKPDWMKKEEDRADELATENKTSNQEAPQMIKIIKAPPRMQKAFYIQEKYGEAFDDLVHKQKKQRKKTGAGKKSTALAEEAIKMLLIKYGEDTSNL